MIGGDFNAKVGKEGEGLADTKSDSRGSWLLSRIVPRGFVRLNGTWPSTNGGCTYRSKRSGLVSTPDHILMSKGLYTQAVR